MIGLIPNVLEKLVEETAGSSVLEDVKRKAGIPVEKNYELNAFYPDEEWQAFLASACEVLGMSGDEAEQAYADFFGQDSLERWPMWFKMSENSQQFLQRQPAIHNTFATASHDAETRKRINDKFRIEVGEDSLTAHYRSPNGHCGLYQKLARWIINHYGDDASIEETQCMKQGASSCIIQVTWH